MLRVDLRSRSHDIVQGLHFPQTNIYSGMLAGWGKARSIVHRDVVVVCTDIGMGLDLGSCDGMACTILFSCKYVVVMSADMTLIGELRNLYCAGISCDMKYEVDSLKVSWSTA